MNLKQIIAAGILLMSLAACVEERSNHGETAPGWVAFEYTSALVERCGITAEYLHRFDRYLEQNTSSGRDSVDRLYFSNVKIQRDQEPNAWTLRLKERYGNERTITIRNAVRGGMWEVVGEGLATKFSPRSERAVDHFRVNTGKSGTWSTSDATESLPTAPRGRCNSSATAAYSSWGMACGKVWLCLYSGWTSRPIAP